MTLTLVKPLAPRITLRITDLDVWDTRTLKDLFCAAALMSGVWDNDAHTASIKTTKHTTTPAWMGSWARYIPGISRTRYAATMVVTSDDTGIIADFQERFESWLCKFHRHTSSIVND